MAEGLVARHFLFFLSSFPCALSRQCSITRWTTVHATHRRLSLVQVVGRKLTFIGCREIAAPQIKIKIL